jgi:flagellar biosynthesis/type III secretory pathway protein FliH
MREAFIPLALWLAPCRASDAGDESCAATIEESEPAVPAPSVPDVDAVLREARRFRAALADALEESRELLLREIAVEVIARELEVRDVDVRAVTARVCERYAIEAPVVVRVHPADAASVQLEYPVLEDEELKRGDAVVEIAAGAIDARLGARLDRVLRALS